MILTSVLTVTWLSVLVSVAIVIDNVSVEESVTDDVIVILVVNVVIFVKDTIVSRFLSLIKGIDVSLKCKGYFDVTVSTYVLETGFKISLVCRVDVPILDFSKLGELVYCSVSITIDDNDEFNKGVIREESVDRPIMLIGSMVVWFESVYRND